MRMAARIRETWHVELPLTAIFGGDASIAGVAAVIDDLIERAPSGV
jgi:hypothetical protein